MFVLKLGFMDKLSWLELKFVWIDILLRFASELTGVIVIFERNIRSLIWISVLTIIISSSRNYWIFKIFTNLIVSLSVVEPWILVGWPWIYPDICICGLGCNCFACFRLFIKKSWTYIGSISIIPITRQLIVLILNLIHLAVVSSLGQKWISLIFWWLLPFELFSLSEARIQLIISVLVFASLKVSLFSKGL